MCVCCCCCCCCSVGLRYVEKVIAKLLEKTNTSNRTALLKRALQTGLLPLEPLEGASRVNANGVFVQQPAQARGGRLPQGVERSRLPPGPVPMPQQPRVD